MSEILSSPAGTLLRSTRPPSLPSDQGQAPSYPAFRRLSGPPLSALKRRPPGRSMTQSPLRKGGPMAMCCPQTQWTGSSPSLVSSSSMDSTGEPDSRDRVFWKKKGVL